MPSAIAAKPAVLLLDDPLSALDVHTEALVERALRDSDLGANPSNDGTVIRVTMPELTAERRKEYIKLAHSQGEDAKVSIRHVRRAAKDTIDKLVKDGEVGEDEGTRGEKDLDALTKKYVETVDTLLKAKEAELSEV